MFGKSILAMLLVSVMLMFAALVAASPPVQHDRTVAVKAPTAVTQNFVAAQATAPALMYDTVAAMPANTLESWQRIQERPAFSTVAIVRRN